MYSNRHSSKVRVYANAPTSKPQITIPFQPISRILTESISNHSPIRLGVMTMIAVISATFSTPARLIISHCNAKSDGSVPQEDLNVSDTFAKWGRRSTHLVPAGQSVVFVCEVLWGSSDTGEELLARWTCGESGHDDG